MREAVKRTGLPAIWIAVVLSGCTHVTGSVPPRGAFEPTGHFLAGAARVDITPIPGIAMGGHSMNGRVSRGVWTRLRARALYLEDADGRGLALVACDLWSIPGGLADRVAELLATDAGLQARVGGRRLGREQLVVAATHTHHSPGLYSTDRFFASLAAPESGFDPALFEFLAQRIAGAIADAVATARPARLYEHRARVGHVFRNRSMPAFRANPEAQEILAANGDLPSCAPTGEYPDPEACRGVDPRVGVLRIEGAEGARIALLVHFTAHPTLVSHLSTVYSADLHGAVAFELERRLARGAADPPPVAVFNGAEGDVSGTWTAQDRSDVLRVAGRIVEAVWPKLERPEPGDWRRVDGAIGFRVERVPLRGQAVARPDGTRGRTAWIPMPGRASAAGAEDGRSDLPQHFFREGKRGLALGAHGAKIGTLDLVQLFGVTIPPLWLTRAMGLAIPPPSRVALGLYRLGPLRIAALPGEFTTALGHRIARAVAPPGGRAEDVLLIGLANDYAYYFTTPEEYMLQHYEGSSTLYGRLSGAHLHGRFADLAEELGAGDGEPAVHRFAYVTRGSRESRVQRLSEDPSRLDGGTAPIDGGREWPRHCWRDAVPSLGGRATTPCARDQGGWACTTPRVVIENETPAGWQPYQHEKAAEDDGGTRLLLLAARAPEASPRPGAETGWCSHWLAPEDAAPGRYRFRVRTLRGPVEVSPAFVP